MRLTIRPLVLAFAIATVSACAAEDLDDASDVAQELKGKQALQRFGVITHNIGGGAESDPGAKGIAYTLRRAARNEARRCRW